MNPLTISIITAVFNSKNCIETCINSVLSQIYKDKEYIVIDGGSTDGTLESIKKSQSGITKLISEKDNGIYYAMNKGISNATGDVIGILNADDFYPSPEILEKVAEVFQKDNIDSCYGDLMYVDSENTDKVIRYWQSGPYDMNKFYQGWMPPHPTFFLRRSVYEKYGFFNLNLGSAADYEMMLRLLLKHRISTTYIPEVLVKMRVGGISNASLRSRIHANRMDRRAWQVNGLKPYPWTLIFKPLRKVNQFFVR